MQPGPPARASWPSSDDHTGFYAVISALGLCALAYMGWAQHHTWISALVLQLHGKELALLHRFTGHYDFAARQLATADPSELSLDDLYGVAHDVGGLFRIPATVLVACLGVACLVCAAPSRFRRKLTADQLIREHAASFPSTRAFVDRHLRLTPIAPVIRPLDYALTPVEWVQRYALDGAAAFDDVVARRELARQLGPRWSGFEMAGPAVRVMAAAFALHLAERRSDASGLLGSVSACLDRGLHEGPAGPETSLDIPAPAVATADAVLRDNELMTAPSAIMAQHAFTHPALMSLLVASRLRAGVLAPSQFAWAKLVDRTLWYALHSLGFEAEGMSSYLHPNPRAEAAGARDHWASERAVGAPLVEPHVDCAIAALRKAYRESIATPTSRSQGPGRAAADPSDRSQFDVAG